MSTNDTACNIQYTVSRTRYFSSCATSRLCTLLYFLPTKMNSMILYSRITTSLWSLYDARFQQSVIKLEKLTILRKIATWGGRRDVTANLKPFHGLTTPTIVGLLVRFPYYHETEPGCQKPIFYRPEIFAENHKILHFLSLLARIAPTFWQSLVDTRSVTSLSEGWQRAECNICRG